MEKRRTENRIEIMEEEELKKIPVGPVCVEDLISEVFSHLDGGVLLCMCGKRQELQGD